ncbi:LuxR C-terminal-related transcriptional regulator [Streptomyces sp. MBT53]|uniref:helix-turn-helix transcriptional regulator n=1 Tax=Streptomyces sp. MBT53 TaxID=1488384 RepID=UPI0019124832|nr:LuxR C-terminal-related transcriptional regulator [Streptomyces sp. MBT53]MBK6014478.1 response regulator transcription factor [Streptomyces sp. MBT53]
MISIAVVASDRITHEGTVRHLRGQSGLQVLPKEQHQHADVLLVLTTDVTEETLLVMETAAAGSLRPDMGIVLVTGSLCEAHAVRAVACGLRNVVRRQNAGYDKVVQAVRNVVAGLATLPVTVQGRLIDHVTGVQRHVLHPSGLTSSGLDAREVEVLRMPADGLDTVEMAQKLNHSERTIKNVVGAMTNRLGLRNRSHAVAVAVAFALRSGALM